MFYAIYKITNLLDGKFYIGSHKTRKLDDNYMGSGKYLKYAQKKYGIENFKKEILFVFDTVEEMYAKEAEIVNEDFLVTENTYNIKLGGFGGFDHLNVDKELHSKRSSDAGKRMHELHPEMKYKLHPYGLNAIRNKLNENGGKAWWEPPKSFKGKKHSPETKYLMSVSQIGKHNGEKNSQFGTMWITDGDDNRKILKNDPIPFGWKKGRKFRKN